MKLLELSAACLFATLSLGAMADVDVPLEHYRYGTQLDVHKVLSHREAPAQQCQVVEARMDYLDSRGQRHSLAYLKYSDSCRDTN
ncbi:DUF2790 domain-containing protein [Metapseudomonas resinovorans]|uniref:Topoisomerase II n=1 Tax=Metapseudomonas resinovorans NBRC 106553 TaxID=1245471 RepID=S6AS19_METRE|nr:DUF2790 domain-containing protein [Pseudomonas resinovorans]BAN48788.1 hypothetical protein PCA10_30560 [Pseudomonas resinovorans NBRC 106553]